MDDTQKDQIVDEEEKSENADEELKADDQSESEESQEQIDVAHLQEQLAEFEAKFKRALADYQNLERHVAEQRSVWARQSAKQIVLKLLPVLDTLILTQKHLQDKGLEVAINQFLQVLKDEGIEQIKTVGEKFDPLFMECIEIREGKDGIVLEETRTGYTMENVVLQPAQVVVGAAKQN